MDVDHLAELDSLRTDVVDAIGRVDALQRRIDERTVVGDDRATDRQDRKRGPLLGLLAGSAVVICVLALWWRARSR